MADFTYGSHAGRGDSGSGGLGHDLGRPDLKRIISLTGAVLSAVLMAGLVWWAWTLMQRDVYGVPVVRALEGAMRESPLDPGGDEANHQGLAVASVQAEGMVSPPPAELTLAPGPMDLAAEDRPQVALLAEQAAASALGNAAAPLPEPEGQAAGVVTLAAPDPAATQVPPNASPSPSPSPTAAVAVPEASIASSAIEAALAEALGLSPADLPADLPASSAAAEVVPVSVPGVARSPRPAPRPEGDGIDTARAEAPAEIASVMLASAAAAPASTPWLSQPAPGVPSLSEASIAVSPGPARVVQLGAFDTPDQAEAEWQRLTVAHADLLGGRGRMVERAVTNGRTFYRLRAGGFDDLADARRFCVALVAGGAACIPVPQ